MRLLALLLAIAACSPAPTDPPDAGLPDADVPDASAPPDAGTPSAELPPPARIGGARPARVVVPAAYDGKALYPAVFALPGYSFTARDLEDWLDLEGRVDTDGFVLVMPEGLRDSDGNTYWNATETCCDYDGANPDDEGYLEGLLDELLRRFAVDPKRVAIVGHSNGAFMGYRLACRHAARWSAIASVAGSMWLDVTRCAAEAPVSVLQVHGMRDDVMPFGGDRDAPGALEVLSRWAALDGCPGALADDAVRREYVFDSLNEETRVSRYAGCPAGIDVELWRMTGADHEPDFRPAFTAAIVDWVLRHPRP